MDAEPRTLAGKRLSDLAPKLWEQPSVATDHRYRPVQIEVREAILAIEAEARADTGLDAAWKAAEAALPERWTFTGVVLTIDRRAWAAGAHGPWRKVDANHGTFDGDARGMGQTPTTALLALAARLGEGRE